MTSLREYLDEYLTMGRALGYRLEKLDRLAGQFCDWLSEQGKTAFTLDDAVTWARLPAEADHRWWGIRLGAVRTFATYLHATGLNVQVPPRGILPGGPCRAVPYIYSQADLSALLDVCPQVFTHGFVADTMATVTGLLAATGMRIGEALRLTPPDIDANSGVLLVRASKNGRDRLVPVHPSTSEHLAATVTYPPVSAPAPHPTDRCSSHDGEPATTAPRSRSTSPAWSAPPNSGLVGVPDRGCTT